MAMYLYDRYKEQHRVAGMRSKPLRGATQRPLVRSLVDRRHCIAEMAVGQERLVALWQN